MKNSYRKQAVPFRFLWGPFFSSSGGLVYHLRACLHLNSLWEEHVKEVKTFLSAWSIPRDRLILVGPSGGYSLPLQWLATFKKIVAIEPDPLARVIFEKRTGLKPEWIRAAPSLETLAGYRIHDDLKTPILFCNVLGQLNFQNEENAKKALFQLLTQRPFASYHDAWSGEGIAFHAQVFHDAKKKESQELEKILKVKNVMQFQSKSKKVEINEHVPFRWFQEGSPLGNLSFYYWPWSITLKQVHLIEGVMKNE